VHTTHQNIAATSSVARGASPTLARIKKKKKGENALCLQRRRFVMT